MVAEIDQDLLIRISLIAQKEEMKGGTRVQLVKVTNWVDLTEIPIKDRTTLMVVMAIATATIKTVLTIITIEEDLNNRYVVI
jgi:hypothetical protein